MLETLADVDPRAGCLVVDPHGRVVFVNRVAKDMAGWGDGDHLGRDVHDVLREASLLAEPNCPRSGADVESGEFVCTAPNGTRRRIKYGTRPLEMRGIQGGMLVTLHDETEEQDLVGALRPMEELHRRLVESSPDGIVVTDEFGYIVMANAEAAQVFGYPDSDAMHDLRWTALVSPEDQLRQYEHTRQVGTGQDPGSVECMAVRQDGSRFPAEIRTRVLAASREPEVTIVYTCTDISEKRQAEMRQRHEELRAGIQHAARLTLAQAVTVGEAAEAVARVVCETADWDVALVWSVSTPGAAMHCLAAWHKAEVDAARFEQVSRSLSPGPGDDLPGRVWKNGSALYVSDIVRESGSSRILMASQAHLRSAAAVPIPVGGSVWGVLELFSRVDRAQDHELLEAISSATRLFGQFIERKEAEQALAHQARHDALTGLPNRILLQERLDRALATSRSQGTPCTFFLMDLDRFKDVNDTLGHQYGDVLLQQVSARLQAVLRERDSVARLGGDEFAVLLPGLDRAAAEAVAQRVLDEVEQPYWLEGHHVDIGGSIGIAEFPLHGGTSASLLQHADVAMYVAKREKVGYAVYKATQDDHSAERLRLTAELREAITQGTLSVHYQPAQRLSSGRIERVEALVRWQHPRLGTMLPKQFVPLAERSGMIKQLGVFVLDTALGQCARWRRAGIHLGIAVNLSAAQVHDPNAVSVVSELLDAHELEPAALILEITESAFMDAAARSMNTLTALHDLGVRLAIDDFGTGYSSLAYLTQLPVDEIKIDRCFVQGMTEHSQDALITRTVIDLGHDLGLEVVAEGVESEAACRLLATMGCDQIQGHYLGSPLPGHELAEYLEREGTEEAYPGLTLLSP